MKRSSNALKALCIMLSVTAISACSAPAKKPSTSDSDKKTTGTVPSNTGSADNNVNRPDSDNPNLPAPAGTIQLPVSACSSNYMIAGTANPFLAGAPEGTELNYDRPTNDVAPMNAPVDVVADDKKCFDAGRRLYFQVGGRIAYDNQAELFSDADGQPSNTPSHTLGSVNGLSNIVAPINSLVGVFLDDKAFAARPAAPETLDFSLPEARDFKTLTPKIGQIFFIGDGKDSAGMLQAFVVPTGTARLYLAIMDQYEWSNNQGQLSGTIQWVKP